MLIFTIIGVLWTSVFIFKRRRLFMDRELFFNQIKNIRGYCKSDYFNNHLDSLIENVTGTDKENEVNEEESLEEAVANVIKKIKKAKENEALRAKSKDLIEQIKKSLED